MTLPSPDTPLANVNCQTRHAEAGGHRHVLDADHAACGGPAERFERRDGGIAVTDDHRAVGVGCQSHALVAAAEEAEAGHAAALCPAERLLGRSGRAAPADDDLPIGADRLAQARGAAGQEAEARHAGALRPAERHPVGALAGAAAPHHDIAVPTHPDGGAGVLAWQESQAEHAVRLRPAEGLLAHERLPADADDDRAVGVYGVRGAVVVGARQRAEAHHAARQRPAESASPEGAAEVLAVTHHDRAVAARGNGIAEGLTRQEAETDHAASFGPAVGLQPAVADDDRAVRGDAIGGTGRCGRQEAQTAEIVGAGRRRNQHQRGNGNTNFPAARRPQRNRTQHTPPRITSTAPGGP
jgi:hypothetical protein